MNLNVKIIYELLMINMKFKIPINTEANRLVYKIQNVFEVCHPEYLEIILGSRTLIPFRRI